MTKVVLRTVIAASMHITGTSGTVVVIINVSPFQRNISNFFLKVNYYLVVKLLNYGKKLIKIRCVDIGYALKTLQLDIIKLYCGVCNILKILWRTLNVLWYLK